jgi:ATP-dependent DNA helicase RecG
MHRLLQGDVGAGKTLVAVGALLMAVDGGHQGAFMAPTEVLAEQHGLAVSTFVDGLIVDDETVLGGRRPLRVELLTSRLGAARRREVLAALADGGVDIAIGTHALIQEGVSFHSLGVVVVDEQHRFGVEQRAVLRDRGPEGRAPDVLVMTATPIPRSAAMTVYGDLDVTVLDEMPPGRTPVVTEWARSDLERAAVWAKVRDEAAAGRQAYVVCPVIEDSEKLDVRSVTATYDELTAGELADLRVGLLHGRLGPDDKDATMELFRRGRLDVLVATTVIEVGVDVPNATVMVILSADRFGIAQLHQLRGRVGRGEHPSVCFAVSDDDVTPDARERLEALVRTTDGFELAEVDLELRGEGTLFGGAQSGRNDLRLASLRNDRDWVERARHQAGALLAGDVALDAHPGLAAELDWFVERLTRDAAEGTEGADWLLKG